MSTSSTTSTRTTPLTTKGDLLTHNGTSVTRLPVGTNGYGLKVNTSEATGLQWAALPTGGSVTWSPIANVEVTTASQWIDFQSINGSLYNAYRIIGNVRSEYPETGNAHTYVGLDFNYPDSSNLNGYYHSASGYYWKPGTSISSAHSSTSLSLNTSNVLECARVSGTPTAGTNWWTSFDLSVITLGQLGLGNREIVWHANAVARVYPFSDSWIFTKYSGRSKVYAEVSGIRLRNYSWAVGSKLTLYGMKG